MRIISGNARGTKLYTLEGNNTRPTLDRVKEALFNKINFQLEEAIVLDLFAGSGALGLEALSRGAKIAYFGENSHQAAKVIKKNIYKTKMQDKAKLIIKDYKKVLEEVKQIKFDIIFLDPPYETNYDIEAIELVLKDNLLKDNGFIVLETDSNEKENKIKTLNIKIDDARKYGRVKLLFLSRKG